MNLLIGLRGAGGPVDLADARAVIDLDRESLDLELLRRFEDLFGVLS